MTTLIAILVSALFGLSSYVLGFVVGVNYRRELLDDAMEGWKNALDTVDRAAAELRKMEAGMEGMVRILKQQDDIIQGRVSMPSPIQINKN